MTDSVLAALDEASNTFFCPAGYKEWETCDPASCPCDRDTQKHSCVKKCCFDDDVFSAQVCRAGEWTCEGIHSSVEFYEECVPLYESGSCPCETYLGWQGDVCDANGDIVCAVTSQVLEVCYDIVCQTCDGFNGPIEGEGCRCACRDGAVWCDAVDP